MMSILFVFSYVKISFVCPKMWALDYKYENPKIVLEVT